MALIFDLGFGCAGGGGGSANLTTLDVTPMTNAQSILPNTGYDGFSLVNVSAVTSSIDPNISASNIVNGCQILGVTGTAQTGDFVGITRAVENGVFGYPSEPFTYTCPSNVTDVANAFVGAFKYCSTLESLDFHTVINANASFTECCPNCTSLKSINFSSLTKIAAACFMNSFMNCISLEKAEFPSLNNGIIYGFRNAFAYCYNLTDANFNSITKLNSTANCFTDAFKNCFNLVNVDFSSLTEINSSVGVFFNAFYGCNSLQNINFSSLKSVNSSSAFTNKAFDYAFVHCEALEEINFPSLETVNMQYAFNCAFDVCTSVKNAFFPKLYYVAQGAFDACFWGCSNLTNAYFPNVAYLYFNSFQNAFKACSNLTSISFPNLSSITGTTAFSNAFNGCTNLTEIHFPAAMQTQIESQTGYATKWGAANATIYFDL